MGIAEAMAAGTPVITSNRCGMPYMVRDGRTGFLVAPEDPPSVARRLREILGNRELARQMGRRARRFAWEHFRPDEVARLTLEVYREAIGSFAKPIV